MKILLNYQLSCSHPFPTSSYPLPPPHLDMRHSVTSGLTLAHTNPSSPTAFNLKVCI